MPLLKNVTVAPAATAVVFTAVVVKISVLTPLLLFTVIIPVPTFSTSINLPELPLTTGSVHVDVVPVKLYVVLTVGLNVAALVVAKGKVKSL